MGAGILESDKLMRNMSVLVVIMVMFTRTATGFLCYKCSYSIWSEGSLTDCIDKPEALGGGDRLECNSTSYCVFSEHYRINDGKIESYFRTCSGTTWGNECASDQSHLTCKGSCRGNFCNSNDKGDKHVQYLDNHKGGQYRNDATCLKGKTLKLTLGLIGVFLYQIL